MPCRFLLFTTVALFLFVGLASAQNIDSLFAPAVNYDVDGFPCSIVTTDFNGDGNNDLAVANHDSNNISVLMGNGDGSFQSAVNYAIGGGPMGMIASDLDGDGDNDMAVTTTPSGDLLILLNNGNGTFQTPVTYGMGFGALLQAADLDGDGDEDLVTFNSLLQILINDGSGSFVPGASYQIPVSEVVVSDFDGDGDKDLALCTVDEFFGGVMILMNNGDATFYVRRFYSSEWGQLLSICASDFDGDADNDLAAGSNSFEELNVISILINDGSGLFQGPSFLEIGPDPYSIIAADFDEDGDNDIAGTESNGGCVALFRNYDNGAFDNAIRYSVGAGPYALCAADFDGDGDKDLAVANSLSNNISILLNRTTETGIKSSDEPTRASSISLSQNYPNPFNAQTVISFSLPKSRDVTIDIFDILGRKIETLAQGIKPAGEHKAIWDSGVQSSGIYFYRLKAGDKVETKKMVLMK